MTDALPTDPAQLQALLAAALQREAGLQAELKRTQLERDTERAWRLALLKRYFGRSSEKLDPSQLELAIAAVDADRAVVTAPAPQTKPRAVTTRRARRLEDLPVLETIRLDLSEAEKRAPDGTALVQIREEITDEVDYQPGKLFRRQFIRPVYASPSHQCAPRVAALPARVIAGGQVGAGLVAHVVLSKFVDHLPLHRQARMLERLGPCFTRQTMGQWVEQAALLLQSVHTELQGKIRRSGFQQMDETPIALLDPERPGAARDAWLWVSHAPTESAVCFGFHLTRGHGPPLAWLRDFSGILQTDGFAAYETALAALPPGQIVHLNCWAHARRHLVAALESGDDRATPFLVQIGKLYAIEADLRDADGPTRAQGRSLRSTLVLAELNGAFQRAVADPAILASSLLGKAVRYALLRWSRLEGFTAPDRGHVPIDTNPTENCLRPTKLGLRNWLFIGHPDAGERCAVIYSVLGTCKLLKVDPWAYLTWALPNLAAATNRTAANFTPHAFTALRRD